MSIDLIPWFDLKSYYLGCVGGAFACVFSEWVVRRWRQYRNTKDRSA